MPYHDVCVAWIAEQDAPFILRFDDACHARGLTVLHVTPASRDRRVAQLAAGEVVFGVLFDRASDEDDGFLPLVVWAGEHTAVNLNPYARARRAADKAATHGDLSVCLNTPRTIVVPPFAECPVLVDLDLRPLGPAITVKPAHGGGGDGVVVLEAAVEPVQAARQQYPQDSYLLQTHVVPAQLGGRPAWFRIIYAAGRVYPFWWDPRTHAYSPVSVAEENGFGLRPLQEMTGRIAEICGLSLFSTEIARQDDGAFQVVDYVNDPLDLTPQSLAPNGVPDQVLGFIAEDLAGWIAARRRPA
jgi:hypothetical protein